MPGKVLLILALFACAGAGCGPGACMSAEKFTYKLTRFDDMTPGQTAPVTLTLVNRSQLYMVVYSVTGGQLASQSGTSLLIAREGSLQPSQDGGTWTYLAQPNGMTPHRFSLGVIPPGTRLEVQAEVTPKRAEGQFHLLYIALTPQEMARHVYVKVSEEGNSTVYKRLDADQLIPATVNPQPAPRPGLFAEVVVSDDLKRRLDNCSMELPYRLDLPQAAEK